MSRAPGWKRDAMERSEVEEKDEKKGGKTGVDLTEMFE